MEETLGRIAWNRFCEIRTADPNCRDASYEHCREFFISNCNNKRRIDEMALHLYAYLASWGMLRNPFMMQKDYLFHSSIVSILCEEQYRPLLDWEPLASDNETNSKMVELVVNLKERIVTIYKDKGEYYIDTESDEDPKPHNIKNVTDTLASKIILGTFGCVPAYDENLVRGLGEIRPKTLSINGLNEVIKFANENKAFIENCKKDLMNRIGDASKLYTTMKIVDILLFGKGVQKRESNKLKK